MFNSPPLPYSPASENVANIYQIGINPLQMMYNFVFCVRPVFFL
ncbi:hypothetical protein [Okeania hirsuta]